MESKSEPGSVLPEVSWARWRDSPRAGRSKPCPGVEENPSEINIYHKKNLKKSESRICVFFPDPIFLRAHILFFLTVGPVQSHPWYKIFFYHNNFLFYRKFDQLWKCSTWFRLFKGKYQMIHNLLILLSSNKNRSYLTCWAIFGMCLESQ